MLQEQLLSVVMHLEKESHTFFWVLSVALDWKVTCSTVAKGQMCVSLPSEMLVWFAKVSYFVAFCWSIPSVEDSNIMLVYSYGSCYVLYNVHVHVWWSPSFLPTLNTAISTPEGNCSDGNIRVANGSSQAGRVEICINNAWGTVCDSLFGTQDAAVACAQLGGFNRNSKFLWFENVLLTSTSIKR